MKLGVELLREYDQPSSAPIRPYITDKPSPSAASPLPLPSEPQPTKADLEERVLEAVRGQVGDTVDSSLLKTIIARVLKSVGGR
jgi:hypothetical protein